MERPKIEDFNKGFVTSFDEALKFKEQYSKKQDEYIDYLENQALNIQNVSNQRELLICECKEPDICQDNTGLIYCFDCKRKMT